MHYPKKINCSLFGCMTCYWYTYSSFNQYRESTLVSCTMNVCTKTTVERNCIRNRKIIFASGCWVLFVLFGLDEKWPDRPEPKQPQKCAIPTQKLRQFFLSMNQKEQGHSAEETDRLNSKHLCVRENDQRIFKSIFKSLHFSNYLTRYIPSTLSMHYQSD